MRVEELIDQLEHQIRDARETPLIGGARIDTTELTVLLTEISAELSSLTTPLDDERYVRRAAGVWAPMLPALDAIDDEIHEAPGAPHGPDPGESGKLSGNLRRIRAAFSQGTLLALTN